MTGSEASVRGYGKLAGLSSLKLVGDDRRTLVGGFFLFLLLLDRFADRRIILVRLVKLRPVLQILRQLLGLSVEFLGVGVAVILESAPVHRDIPDRYAGGLRQHPVEPFADLFLEVALGTLFFNLFLFGEVKHERVFPLQSGRDLTDEQHNHNHQMEYDGDVKSCPVVALHSINEYIRSGIRRLTCFSLVPSMISL